MKKLVAFISLLWGLSFLASNVQASHYMGGEITWECLSNGKYVFSLRTYRECAGITFGSTQTLHSNSPAGNITLSLVSGYPKDISPTCNLDSTFLHISCAGAQTYNTGAVSEYLYKSGEIIIQGTPPATGWMFYWSSCCRNPSTNIYQANTSSWYLKAVMYPFGSQSAYPCFDSSPDYIEPPKTVLPTGNYSVNNMAKDADMDSLVYDWGHAKANNNNLPYNTSYSYDNPLPDNTLNSNNISAVLDSSSGFMEGTSYTSGAFVISIKTTSYKCGIKVSEIWRELQVVIIQDSSNLEPEIIPPFSNGTSYDTILHVGDTARFNIISLDYHFLPNNMPQSIDLKFYGSQFGEYIPATGSSPSTFSETTGCTTPPCASMLPADIQGAFGVQSQFQWVVTCDHLKPVQGCNKGSNIYKFHISSKDDYCPVPSQKHKVITIKVVDRDSLPVTNITNVVFDYNSSEAVISWLPIADPYNQFDAYYIYASNNATGPFTLMDSTNNINDTTLRIYTGGITEKYFALKVKSHTQCRNNLWSDFSPVYYLNLTSIQDVVHFDGFYLLQNKPNPASDKTQIEFLANKAAKVRFRIMTQEGRIVQEKEFAAVKGLNKNVIDLNAFANGIYYYSIQMNGIIKSKKLVVLR